MVEQNSHFLYPYELLCSLLTNRFANTIITTSEICNENHSTLLRVLSDFVTVTLLISQIQIQLMPLIFNLRMQSITIYTLAYIYNASCINPYTCFNHSFVHVVLELDKLSSVICRFKL